jgi:hypothetical protein
LGTRRSGADAPTEPSQSSIKKWVNLTEKLRSLPVAIAVLALRRPSSL